MSSARPVPNSTDFFFPWFTNALRGYAGNIAVTVDALFSAFYCAEALSVRLLDAHPSRGASSGTERLRTQARVHDVIDLTAFRRLARAAAHRLQRLRRLTRQRRQSTLALRRFIDG
jgi:hypothetical protein